MLSGLSLDRLRSFLAVVDRGSISKAADRDLHKQSLYSRQIRELEEFFGTELTKLRGKRIAITPAGRRLAELVREHLRDLGDFLGDQRGLGKAIRVGAGASVLHWLVMPRAAEVRRVFRDATLTLVSLKRSSEVVEGVREGHIDFGVVREDAIPEGLPREKLGQLTFNLCVPEPLLQRFRAEAASESCRVWSELPFALGDGSGRLDRAVREALAGPEPGESFQPAFQCDSLLMVRQIVVAGLAAGVLPSIACEGLREAGVVVSVFEPLKNFGECLCLCWDERNLRRRGIVVGEVERVAGCLRGGVLGGGGV